MYVAEEGCLLRVYVGESDRWQGKPVYEAVVLKARELHVAGATVFRGSLGYGATSRLHTVKILQLSEDLPVVVEIIDRKQKIDELLPHLSAMLAGGFVTIENLQILRHSGPGADGL